MKGTNNLPISEIIFAFFVGLSNNPLPLITRGRSPSGADISGVILSINIL